MQISLSTPLAEGRTAEVYEWGADLVLKLYRDWCPAHWVEHESKVAHAITAAGIPTPAAGEIVEVNNRRGLIYQRVSGVSMLQDMNTRPWMIFKHARTLAELQVKVNQLSIPGLHSGKAELLNTLKHAPELDDELRKKVLDHCASLADGELVCHGDFHPGNVLLTEQGAVIIDWMTASAGNPWGDVARTGMLLSIGAKNAGKQVSPILRAFIRLYRQVYLKRYMSLVADSNHEFAKWLPVIAAARLDERIAGEQGALIQMVQDGLAG
jgi:aminoglycoside phosphotransferase (APT) family kinase protein